MEPLRPDDLDFPPVTFDQLEDTEVAPAPAPAAEAHANKPTGGTYVKVFSHNVGFKQIYNSLLCHGLSIVAAKLEEVPGGAGGEPLRQFRVHFTGPPEALAKVRQLRNRTYRNP